MQRFTLRSLGRSRGWPTFLAATLALALGITACAPADTEEELQSASAPRGNTRDAQLDCGADPSKKALRAAANAPSLDAESSANPMKWFAHQIGEDLFDFGADEGFGWLLSLLTGEGRGSAEWEKKVNDTYNEVSNLRVQVYDLCTSLDNRLAELDARVDLKAYQNAAANLKGDPLAALNTYQDDYDDIVSTLKSHASDPGYKLSGDHLHDLDSIRVNIVREVISPLNTAMSSTPDADGLIGMYADVLADYFGYAPVPTQETHTATRIFLPDYVSVAYDQYNFYAGALVQALLLYAETVNTAYTFQGETYTPDPAEGQSEATRVTGYLDAWGGLLWGGRKLAGQTDNWVTSDLGPIPDGTVADLRVKGKPQLWTDEPVGLLGDANYRHQVDPAGNPTKRTPTAYCGVPTAFCTYQRIAADGTLLDSTPVRPLPGPIDRLLSSQAPYGFADWTVPTETDWTNLQAGATGGLEAWGKLTRLPQFASEEVTSTLTGTKQTSRQIAPVLVDLGGDGQASYGVLSGRPSDDRLTLRRDEQDRAHALAGRLFLTRAMLPTKLDGTLRASTATTSSMARQGSGRPQQGNVHRAGGKASVATTCGAAFPYTVPAGVTAIDVTARGGAGGSGGTNGKSLDNGGRGGSVRATLAVPPGTRLLIQKGQNGGRVSAGDPDGADGGAFWSYNADKTGPWSGGGGGASGVTASTACSSWLVLAAGGGGGGSADVPVKGTTFTGGRGGDACPPTGLTGCLSAGAGKGTHDQVGGAGGRAPTATPGVGGTTGYTTGPAGKGPGVTTGGAGGAGKPTGQQANNYDSAGGGGAGAGYPGGSGGGAGLDSGGGGGGGGTSYSADPFGETAFDFFDPGTSNTEEAGVTITPADPIEMVLQSAATGQVLNISGGNKADGASLIQWVRWGDWNEAWKLEPVDDDVYQIVNPESDKCVTVGSARIAGNPVAQLDSCASGREDQRWRVQWLDDGTARISNSDRVLGVSGTSQGSAVVAAPMSNDYSARWAILDARWPSDHGG